MLLQGLGLITLVAIIAILGKYFAPPPDALGSELRNFDSPSRRRMMIKAQSEQDEDMKFI
jgi:hypothetical protein